ncbi:MAG: FtsX-like permease family protein [Nitrospinae bacterium]|nr:FtsX-like permease family protein [Nitrospinota bacterium]
MNMATLAFRNLGRNRLRAAATVGAMALAGGIMILYSTLVDGIVETIERNVVEMETGEMQIHSPKYREDPDIYYTVKDPAALIEKLDAMGYNAAPRLYGFGLAAAGQASSGVWMKGVDFEREASVTQLQRHISEGSWLSPGDLKGVVIGKKLAKSLNAGPGSEIVIVSQAMDGSTANEIFIVRGVLKLVGEGTDRAGVIMLEPVFREVMVMPNGAHQIAVSRRGVVPDMKTAAAQVGAAAAGLETKTWREMRPVIARMLDITQVMTTLMLLITYSAIVMVTLNAMLMNVFERIPEFGVMKAVGLSPMRLMGIVLTEAALEASVACVLACAAGLPLSLYAQSHGIDLSRVSTGISAGGVALDPVWYARVTPGAVLFPLAVLFLVAMLAVIYPGIKAAMINPREAIYHR